MRSVARPRLAPAFHIALALAAFQFSGCASSTSAPQTRATQRESLTPSEESILFSSGAITLGGTLIIPPGSAPHPAVVLFHGSGPQERDLFTARWFASQGVVALAYDKRGVGDSTGDFRTVPFMDICEDGLAGITYLKSRKEVNPKRIGVWGLSQGGWLGPLAASRSNDVRWVIAVSGPGVSPGEQMIVYYANELRDRGLPEKDVEEASALRREIYTYLFSGRGFDKASADLLQASKKSWARAVKSQQDSLFDRLQKPSELNERDSPRIMQFAREMSYDPVPALKALHVPALFLFGDQDRLIPVDKSVDVIRATLTQSGDRDFAIQVFPDVDHGMYSTTGATAGDISHEYLEVMQKWLVSHGL